MNKYQEALDFITDHTHPMCETMKDMEALDFSYNILQELVDKETLDYLNRKDKLVVGSEWACDVCCYHRYGEHDSGNIVLVSELVGGDVRYYNSREDLCEMPLEQFLVCFSPVEKENV